MSAQTDSNRTSCCGDPLVRALSAQSALGASYVSPCVWLYQARNK